MYTNKKAAEPLDTNKGMNYLVRLINQVVKKRTKIIAAGGW